MSTWGMPFKTTANLSKGEDGAWWVTAPSRDELVKELTLLSELLRNAAAVVANFPEDPKSIQIYRGKKADA